MNGKIFLGFIIVTLSLMVSFATYDWFILLCLNAGLESYQTPTTVNDLSLARWLLLPLYGATVTFFVGVPIIILKMIIEETKK